MSEKSSKQFWDDRYAHLNHLPEHILFDLARNDAAPSEYRLTAVEIMLKKGFKKAKHPELARFAEIIEQENEDFKAAIPVVEHESEVEIAYNTGQNTQIDGSEPSKLGTAVEIREINIGAPSASVTTATMFGTPPVHFPDDPVPENE